MATFALIHGAWHDCGCWEPLVASLAARGHRAVTCDLPCAELSAGFEEYAAVVLSALNGVVDPILVGHSLGADTAAVVAAKRPDAQVVYLCPRMGGFARPPGAEPTVFRETFRWTGKDELGRTYWSRDDALRVLYPRVERRLAERMARRLRPQADLRGRPYPLSGPPAVPSTFVLALEDECFALAWSRWAARTLLDTVPIELPGGHFPMLERPDELAEILERRAGD